MRRILCIVTSTHDPLTEEVIAGQQAQKDCSVEVVALGAKPDYEKVMDAILEADSVQVW
jgi:hypothetical protein